MVFGSGKKEAAKPVEKPGSAGINAFLGTGTTFEGRFEFTGTAQLSGRFVGDIHSGGILIVGETGEVEGGIDVAELRCAGKLSGEIMARRKVVLHASAVVEGTLRTPALEMDDGAVIQGDIRMQEMASKG